jgi:hypothetical protein
VPGECTSECVVGEVCTTVTGATFGNGRQFGVCLPEGGGTGTAQAYEPCSGSNFCAPGLTCRSGAGIAFRCLPPCDDVTMCPTTYNATTVQTACVLTGIIGSGERFCAIECDYGGIHGSLACPTGMVCLPWPNGGVCAWPAP